ncbi:MAG: hypothetical protein QM831_12300 [Kofleriaceae bacterium]
MRRIDLRFEIALELRGDLGRRSIDLEIEDADDATLVRSRRKRLLGFRRRRRCRGRRGRIFFFGLPAPASEDSAISAKTDFTLRRLA